MLWLLLIAILITILMRDHIDDVGQKSIVSRLLGICSVLTPQIKLGHVNMSISYDKFCSFLAFLSSTLVIQTTSREMMVSISLDGRGENPNNILKKFKTEFKLVSNDLKTSTQ